MRLQILERLKTKQVKKVQKCWICNKNVANSGEHKIKAAEIRKLMGNKRFDGFYKGEENKLITIENSKDKNLKFPKVICDECNNNKTAQSDKAYTDFVSFITDNYDSLHAQRKIDFKEIYGENWSKRKIELYRYFAKHFLMKEFPILI